MNDNNLFCLKNLDDLTPEQSSEIHICNSNDKKILELFCLKNELTINELMVAYFRKFNVNRKRSYFANRLFILSKKKNLIERVIGKKATYKLITQ